MSVYQWTCLYTSEYVCIPGNMSVYQSELLHLNYWDISNSIEIFLFLFRMCSSLLFGWITCKQIYCKLLVKFNNSSISVLLGVAIDQQLLSATTGDKLRCPIGGGYQVYISKILTWTIFILVNMFGECHPPRLLLFL